MLKSLLLILTIACSITFAAAQTPEAAGTAPPKAEKARDLPLNTGVDLQFLIKELARDMELNVVFDKESFGSPGRKAAIELRNVTQAEALNALLRQEHLIAERIDAKTILVALESRGPGRLSIGVELATFPDQLSQNAGALINAVKPDTPAAKAGLKAGDVITELDNTPIHGALTLIRALIDRAGTDVTLKIIRDRKPQMITLSAPKGIGQ